MTVKSLDKRDIKTVTIQIGNSDNKLTQQQWADFVIGLRKLIDDNTKEIHFTGCSPGDSHWQNFAVIFNATDDTIHKIKHNLKYLGEIYEQDSIAITIGITEFI